MQLSRLVLFMLSLVAILLFPVPTLCCGEKERQEEERRREDRAEAERKMQVAREEREREQYRREQQELAVRKDVRHSPGFITTKTAMIFQFPAPVVAMAGVTSD
eukprot:GHVS01066123.1.p1 GENE.GHVS01066123.1~~GHVS01066123.1.p1  ORF type:complete len:104 (+),score=19.61 GHVS01066123.1:130-441(+)